MEVVPSKQAFTLAEGDELRILSGGGGGHGSPLEREPRRFLADVLDGKVSADAACSVYGVVLDIETQAVDEEATDGLRARLRGENAGKGAVWDRGFEHVEEAAANGRDLRPAPGESRAMSGRERQVSRNNADRPVVSPILGPNCYSFGLGQDSCG